jgi:phosphoglycerol transferase MdoB-like AlkP superfamily enzyme
MNLTAIKRHRYAPALLLAIVAVLISVVTRTALFIAFRGDLDMTFAQFISSFFIGLFYDLVIASFLIIPLVLQVTFTNEFIYTKKGGILAVLVIAVVAYLLFFTHVLPKDFSHALFMILEYYLLFRVVVFLLLYTQKQSVRLKWRALILQFLFFLIVFLLLFNAASEWFFWKEFASRYNFIAVDYLVYTNEVVGNIRESYPLFAIVSALGFATLLIFLFTRKSIVRSVQVPMHFVKRLLFALALLLIPFACLYLVKPQWKNFSKNNYANELAGNGIYEFLQAYKNNELDYYKYYYTLPDSTAFTLLRQQLSSPYSAFTGNDLFSIERKISYPDPEKKMNVVLISVESLSASYMGTFGNTQNLTPQLDALARQGLLFTQHYASGTRTVRGLEALSLSIPPTPGQSIVKRPNNEDLFSLGSVFKSKGYVSQYIYGGYGYFDNMNYFFGHNDYEVIDRSALAAKDIHYANIWGVADEDLFTLTLRTLDSNYKAGKSFFSHVMTVSNHRPYTYPDGRIDIPSSTQSREGAIKYTDYAIGDFIKRASSHPWFSNTLFVIVADHCASSAGSTGLPVTGYHIPLIFYSPAHIAPSRNDHLTAQIDIVPSILGFLNMSYTSKFFGQDMFHTEPGHERAFISTYQGLGYLRDSQLVVQSPVKKIKTYRPDFNTGKAQEITGADSLTHQAIAYYQVASWLISNKRYGKNK